MEIQAESGSRVGWPITAYVNVVGISKAGYYAMPEDLKPRSVKIGKRRLIVEQPLDWLRRVGQATEG